MTETVEVPKDEYEELKELAKVGKLVEIRSEGDDPTLEDIWLAGQPVGKIIESNRKKADTATKEARATASSEDNPEGKSIEDGPQDSDMLPIERLAQLQDSGDDPEDNPFAKTTPSVDRAVAIYQHFREWSSKAPSGRVIRDNLRTLLNTATGEQLAWKQIYRACRKLVEWSKGAITFKKTRRHGWILVQERSSSARTG